MNSDSHPGTPHHEGPAILLAEADRHEKIGVESETVFTEQQAKDLAVILTRPRTFRQLGPTTVTVEAGGHVAG
ncbi:MAG: hypothetical protein HOV83_23095 [Catenulispora sp.]|nr:hypothetical protein [Catenulispora sp.]